VELRVFASAAESMEYLQHEKPALLFLDIIMPDKDGLTFLQELRKNPAHMETPVVVISSKDYAQDRLTAKTLGAVEYVAKPMSKKTIRDLIIKYTRANNKPGAKIADAPKHEKGLPAVLGRPWVLCRAIRDPSGRGRQHLLRGSARG
jgi:CheY-like chemotaxis protein